MLLIFICLHVPMLGVVIASINTHRTDKGHIVVLTSPFFGHIIPLLDLAKRLSTYHDVSYIVSVSKINILQRRGFLDEYRVDNSVHPFKSRLKVIGLLDGNDNELEVS